jgi:hypothetical protein
MEELADGGRNDEARDALLHALLEFQSQSIAAYGQLAQRMKAAEGPVGRWPAVPTDVFRHARMAVHDPKHDVRVFRTSGTTHELRGAHPFRDLSMYDRSAHHAAAHALFPQANKCHLIVLAPPESESPESSLSYMLARFSEWFETRETVWVMRRGKLDLGALEAALRAASGPTALLGTSFAFVHAEDGLGDFRVTLPRGSRIMQTGGFKGRSREVTPQGMRRILKARYGVPEHRIVAEYGMTELSSQMYETTLTRPEEVRRLWVPGWVRATPVDPETLKPVGDGEVGILRIDDAANVDSLCAIQTSDLARKVEDGIEVLGRAAGATPRGCSIAVDAMLGDRRR